MPDAYHAPKSNSNGRHSAKWAQHHPTLSRNVAVFMLLISIFCFADVLYVGWGIRRSSMWLDVLGPAFTFTMFLWANWNIRPSDDVLVLRWLARISLSVALFVVYYFVIFAFGVPFHLAIGGRL